jgi:hypothetical protein
MRSRILTWSFGIVIAGGIYWIVYCMMFAFVFAIGDMAEPPRGFTALVANTFGVLLAIFGFPFMNLGWWPWGVELSRSIFGGDDTFVILGLMTLNAVIWGALLYATYLRIRRRRAIAA